MQPHDSNDQRATQVDSDGGRDAERSAEEATVGVATAQTTDEVDRTVCLSANLAGKGGLAG